MLVEINGAAEEVDMVVGAVESNKTDHKAANGLNPALAVEAEQHPARAF